MYVLVDEQRVMTQVVQKMLQVTPNERFKCAVCAFLMSMSNNSASGGVTERSVSQCH